MQYYYLTHLTSSSLRELLSNISRLDTIYINILETEDDLVLRILADVVTSQDNKPTIILAGTLNFHVLEFLTIIRNTSARIVVLNTASMLIDIRKMDMSMKRIDEVLSNILSTNQYADLIINGILVLEAEEITTLF